MAYGLKVPSVPGALKNPLRKATDEANAPGLPDYRDLVKRKEGDETGIVIAVYFHADKEGKTQRYLDVTRSEGNRVWYDTLAKNWEVTQAAKPEDQL